MKITKKFWLDMDWEGFIVVDNPGHKIAIFANENGSVSIASQEFGKNNLVTLEHADLENFCMALVKASYDAAFKCSTWDAEYAAHLAIEKAQESAK